MTRCKICKGLHDVRADGLCGGCYDNRMAKQFGLSYGKYIAIYGHNYLRVDSAPIVSSRTCPICGREMPKYAGKRAVYCGRSCAAAAEEMRDKEYYRRRRDGWEAARGGNGKDDGLDK